MNLLLRPHRHDDESPRGFVWRLAQSNGIQSPLTLYSYLFSKRARLPLLVPDLIGNYQFSKTPTDLQSKLHQESNLRFVLKTGFRICPYCFEKIPYIREIWDYVLLPVCVEHGCELIEVNDVEILWLKKRVEHINAPTLHSENKQTIEIINYLLTRLGLATNSTVENFSEFDQLAIEEFQRLILLIGSFAQRPDLHKPRKAPIKTDIKTSLGIIRNAANTLSNWPHNINQILGGRDLEVVNSRKIFSEYGAIHRALKKELSGEQYEFIKKDYEYFLIKKWPEILDKKSTWFCDEVRLESDYISGTELSKKVGVRLNRVVDWIDRDLIGGNVRHLDSNYRQVTIKKNQEAYLEEIQSLLTLKELCILLGLTKKSARSLVEDELIASIKKGKDNVWGIQKSKIINFINCLKSNSLRETPGESHKTLTYLRRFCTNRAGIRLSEILKKMLDSRVDYIFIENPNCRLTDSIFMESDEYAMCINNNTLISAQDLAIQLGIKQDVSYHLINAGLIDSVKKGRAGRFVTSESINRFLDQYAFLTDIASLLGTSSKYLVETVIKDKTIFISGPTIDSGRQYILKRSDAGLVFDLYRSM